MCGLVYLPQLYCSVDPVALLLRAPGLSPQATTLLAAEELVHQRMAAASGVAPKLTHSCSGPAACADSSSVQAGLAPTVAPRVVQSDRELPQRASEVEEEAPAAEAERRRRRKDTESRDAMILGAERLKGKIRTEI
jgi:hypothetical protein